MPGQKQSLDPNALKATGKCKWRLYVSNKFRADGKPNRISQTIGPCSEAQADKKLQELYLEFTKKAPQNANRIRFTQFADIWLKKHSKTLSPNTHNGNSCAIETRLRPYFGHIRLNKISAEMIISMNFVPMATVWTDISVPSHQLLSSACTKFSVLC